MHSLLPARRPVQKQLINSSLRELTLRLASISSDPCYKIHCDELLMREAPRGIIICISSGPCLSPAMTELHQLGSSCRPSHRVPPLPVFFASPNRHKPASSWSMLSEKPTPLPILKVKVGLISFPNSLGVQGGNKEKNRCCLFCVSRWANNTKTKIYPNLLPE